MIPSGNQTWLAGKFCINGGIDRKIIDKWSVFQQTMFDYRRVVSFTLLYQKMFT